MSTGANCVFKEMRLGEWYYAIQRWPYGETEEHDTHGPFGSEEEGLDHLHTHYANPGGWVSIPFKAEGGCK